MLQNYYQNSDSSIMYNRKKNVKSGNWDYHLHDSYEIYFLLDGSTSYFIGKTRYTLKPGDLVIINNNEVHSNSFQGNDNYDRILIMFDPKLLRSFNSQDFNLLECFEVRDNGKGNKISLRRSQIEELLNISSKIEAVNSEENSSNKLLKLSYFIELLVFINKVFHENSNLPQETTNNEKLLPVLNYIDENLEGDLSLEALEKKFFINRYYLSRIFKASVGMSVHKYIVLKRIVKAKALLTTGYDATATCYMCGFKDYSNFIKMFKSIVGISPAKYRTSNHVS
jgi:AraC-like DNA-binding protein